LTGIHGEMKPLKWLAKATYQSFYQASDYRFHCVDKWT